MQLFLVHGMGRSPVGLMPLARALRRAGHTTSFFAYSVARHSFEENARRFLAHVRKNAHADGYGIVAHSLGGILTRFVSPELPPGFSKFVMLGPPNKPVTLAKRMARNALYRGLTGTSGQILSDDAFYEHLPVPTVPTLIIAGSLGPRHPASPFAGEPNDGIVSVPETYLPNAEHLVVPAIHTWIMNDPIARLVMVEFLGARGAEAGTDSRATA